MTRSLPQFIHDLLAAPPRAGEGVHNCLFRVARQLHAHLPAGEIVALLENRVANCGRHVPRRNCFRREKFPAVRVATKWQRRAGSIRREMAGREQGATRGDHARQRRAGGLVGIVQPAH